MSHSTTVADPIPSHQGNGDAPMPAELSAKASDALVARARDIIAGRLPPPELESTPEIDAHMRREYSHLEPPPTTEALRRIKDWLCLGTHYGSQTVACFQIGDYGLSVLAVGEPEIEVLLCGLSDIESAQVAIIVNPAW